jgi:hypothetical protein
LSSQIIRVERPVGLRGLCTLSILPQTEDVRDHIVGSYRHSLGFHPQRNLDVRLRLLVRVILRVLAQSLRGSANVLVNAEAGTIEPAELTLKTMKSSSGTLPFRTLSPKAVRSSWILEITTSVASPDRISFSTALHRIS